MYLQLIYYVLILQLYFNRKTYICVTNFSILISMIIKRHLLFICFLIVCIIKGQAQDITFGHLTTNEGLYNNAVMTMYPDERGYIWITHGMLKTMFYLVSYAKVIFLTDECCFFTVFFSCSGCYR